MVQKSAAKLELINATRSYSINQKKILQAAVIFLKKLGFQSSSLTIYLVGSKKIIQLKKKYFGLAVVTDVLSFPYMRKPIKNTPWILGEIVICLPVACRQAKALDISLDQQIIRLLAHGMVHLSGIDHEKSSSAFKKFQTMELKILKGVLKKIMPLTRIYYD